MRFSYKSFGEGQSAQSRPVIPITLRYGRRSLTCEALIDSGADYSIFGLEFAEELGIDVKTGEKASCAGIDGITHEVYLHGLPVSVDNDTFFMTIGFARLPNLQYGLLGH